MSDYEYLLGGCYTVSKFCCVCGCEIKDSEPYYCVAPNTFTCFNDECHTKYHWDLLAARYVVPGQHEYFVVNGKLYQIGSNDDMPRGMGGRYYVIQFEDGTVRDTRSLWFISDVPKFKSKIFKQNAHFIQKGECGNYD